ncbi:transferrin-like [Macrosteles quadrilineatus]|uniref:transferrin-like n=1 Tax=Macrosteles quadrilineatus TaxID=74068 RepID=UPI0023E20676|nr:transferrin-like [Macrosteles quadrilineatus]
MARGIRSEQPRTVDTRLKIISGEADFAVFEAEDLLMAANNKHLSDILITHRIHATEDKKWEFAVVALVSNNAKISKLSDLRNKKLCHPGFDPFAVKYDWSEVFSLYFENRVTPQSCEKDISIEENRVKALAGYFGKSCKPGQWASNPELDHKLKKKYPKLCGLCDVPSLCSERDKYWGRQGVLYCLSDCLGDVAWSMLKDARLHFTRADVSVCEDVSLLCPDGSTMPLNSTDPCVWVTRPMPVIAARRTKAEDIQKKLKETLLKADTPDDFINLLESRIFTPPLQLKPSITPDDYLATAPGYLSANSMSSCGQDSRAINLCIGTLEEKIKCDWLAAVSRVYGLQPTLNCIYGANCLVSVANKSADVTITTTDKLLPAIRDNGLQPLIVHLPKQLKKAKTVAAIVKSNSKINSLSDLRGKKACFSSVDGIGWTSFAMYLRNTEECPYTKAMSKFFSDICISKPSSSVAPYSNIKVCSEYIADRWFDQGEFGNSQYDNEALAFQCLAVGGGDVAFISKDSIPKYLKDLNNNPDAAGLTVDSFKALCEGTKQDCYLSWSSYSQVMVSDKTTPAKREDIMALFTGLNNLFGHYNSPSSRTFSMFAPSNTLFDTVDSSEMAEVTQVLEQFDHFIKKSEPRPKNYERSVPLMTTCSPSKASFIDKENLIIYISVLSTIVAYI